MDGSRVSVAFGLYLRDYVAGVTFTSPEAFGLIQFEDVVKVTKGLLRIVFRQELRFVGNSTLYTKTGRALIALYRH